MTSIAFRSGLAMLAFLAAIAIGFALYDPHRVGPDVLVFHSVDEAVFTDAQGTHLATVAAMPLSRDWRFAVPLSGPVPQGLVTGVYRLDLDLDEAPSEPTILLPRVSRTVAVTANGHEVYDQEDLDPRTRWQWYSPTIFTFEEGILQAGRNTLELRVTGSFASTSGLSRIMIGERAALAPVATRLIVLQESLPLYANILTIGLSLPLFMIWLQGSRAKAGPFADYGFLAVATALFGLRSLNGQVADAPLPMHVWLGLVSTSLGWAIGLFAIFMLRFAGLRVRWFERTFLALLVVGTAAHFLFPDSVFMQQRTLYWYVPVALTGLACIAAFCVATALAPDPDKTVVAAALILLVPTALHDLMWVRNMLPFEAVLWLPLVMPAVLLAISITVANSFARAWIKADEANRTLRERIAAAEERIRQTYEERLEAQRREAKAAERALLIEDLHDGVGNRLALLLATLQTGSLAPARIIAGLRQCLEDLRMVITARDTAPLHEALGELCALQAPLIDGAGVALEWNPQAPARPVELGPRATLDVLRIVQEAVSNAVRHGTCATIAVTLTSRADGSSTIEVVETGQARARLEPTMPPGGRGLETMRARARRLGATLTIEQGAQRWTVRLILPAQAASGIVAGAVRQAEAAE